MPLAAGQVLNQRYRIVKLLGQGGMGAVYRAWDLNLKCAVAVKENLDPTAEAPRKFESEAQLLYRLRHSHLPAVHDHFFVAGQGQYLVMDFIEGESLDELVGRRGALPEAQALPWILQICEALVYLHTRPTPVIHRDIKPQNIIINPSGEAFLVDFGIARVDDPRLTAGRTSIRLTPGYAPPEQYGLGAVDAQSDVYALGATLWTALTGQVPPDCLQVMKGIAARPRAGALAPGVSPAVDAAIEAALELEKADRLPGAAAFRSALLGQAAPHPAATPAKAGARTGRRILLAGLLAVATLLGLLAWPGSPLRAGAPRSPTATAPAAAALPSATPAIPATSTPAATGTATAPPASPTATAPLASPTAPVFIIYVREDFTQPLSTNWVTWGPAPSVRQPPLRGVELRGSSLSAAGISSKSMPVFAGSELQFLAYLIQEAPGHAIAVDLEPDFFERGPGDGPGTARVLIEPGRASLFTAGTETARCEKELMTIQSHRYALRYKGGSVLVFLIDGEVVCTVEDFNLPYTSGRLSFGGRGVIEEVIVAGPG